MSPGSMTLPTSSSWEQGQGLSSYTPLPPPDMQSTIERWFCVYNVSIRFCLLFTALNNGNYVNHSMNNMSYDYHQSSASSDFCDPLSAMEKSLNLHHEQHQQQLRQRSSSSDIKMRPPVYTDVPTIHTNQSPRCQSNPLLDPMSSNACHAQMNGPHTPNTPCTSFSSGSSHGGPHTPHTPGSSANMNPMSNEPMAGKSNQVHGNASSSVLCSDLSDLNFDPTAIIDGDGQESLNVSLLHECLVDSGNDHDFCPQLLPEVDSLDLLSFLDPSDSSGIGTNSSTNTLTSSVDDNVVTDDILSLFDD